MIETEIGQTTTARITVRGYDLADDLIGHVDFIDMMMLTSCGRAPTDSEKTMLNALMVSVMDHGFTPSSIAARLTYLGAPEAPQAAVAAGLLGAGSVFLGAMQDAGQMLIEASTDLPEYPTQTMISETARTLVNHRRRDGQVLYGLGHNIHHNGDPRVGRLRELARQLGYYDRHWQLLDAIEHETRHESGRLLPINAAGAVGASIAAMGLPLAMARGITLVSRTAGLVAHLLEEKDKPVGKDIWKTVLQQDIRNEL